MLRTLLRDGYTGETTTTTTVEVDSCVRAPPTFTALPAIVDVERGRTGLECFTG